MAFVEDHYEGYEAPRLVVRLLHDAVGAPYLLLSGPEPDTHWEAFTRSVREVVEHFGVRLTVSLGSVPMAVPHTRPVMESFRSDGLCRGPLRGVRGTPARRTAAARRGRRAVPPAVGAGARHPLGGVHPVGARGRGALRRAADGVPGVGADGGPAHPPGDGVLPI